MGVCSRQKGWRCSIALTVWAATLTVLAASAEESPPELEPAAPALRELEQAFRGVVAEVTPSVVGIRVHRRWFTAGPASAQDSPLVLQQTIIVNGSGTIVREDGSILTNEHVIQAASDIEVMLHDGRVLPARVVAADARSDLAILRVPATGLAAIEMCDWDSLTRGQWSISIGNPYGLGADGQLSVSVGVVANLGRRLPGLGENDDRLYTDMIQTTAAINPGNSGGPLLNLRGQLIGVITAMHTRTAGDEGVGFAIPMNPAKRRIVERLLEGQAIEYAYLGLSVRGRHAAAAGSADAGDEVVVEAVDPDGPAARAGVREGDRVLAFEGRPVSGSAELLERVLGACVGRPVALRLKRAAKVITVEVVPQRREVSRVSWLRGGAVLWRGVRVADLTPEAREQWQVRPEARGVVVVDVATDSPGQRSGIRPGDVIERVQDRAVDTAAAFRETVQSEPGDVELELHGRGRVRVLP
jgi:serine protease Do